MIKESTFICRYILDFYWDDNGSEMIPKIVKHTCMLSNFYTAGRPDQDELGRGFSNLNYREK